MDKMAVGSVHIIISSRQFYWTLKLPPVAKSIRKKCTVIVFPCAFFNVGVARQLLTARVAPRLN